MFDGMLNIFFNDFGIQDWIDSCQELQMWWWEIKLSNECVNMDGGLVVSRIKTIAPLKLQFFSRKLYIHWVKKKGAGLMISSIVYLRHVSHFCHLIFAFLKWMETNVSLCRAIKHKTHGALWKWAVYVGGWLPFQHNIAKTCDVFTTTRKMLKLSRLTIDFVSFTTLKRHYVRTLQEKTA